MISLLCQIMVAFEMTSVFIPYAVRAALAKHSQATGVWTKPRLVYFENADEFEEIEQRA